MQGRVGTISRPATLYTGTVKYAPSNYSRNLETSSNTIVTGREFVIAKESLTAINFPEPKRGDRITDSEFGTLTLTDIREMYDLGGAVIAYRVRTG